MIKSDIKDCLFNLIGFRQHYNADAQITDTDLLESESGEFWQDLHPALQLNIIKQSLERDRNLDEYLTEKVNSAIIGLKNDITRKKIGEGVKDLLFSNAVLNKLGWYNDRIIGNNRFVGFAFEVKNGIGLNINLSEIGFQLNGASTFDLYVYHSAKEEAEIIPVNIATANGWNWQKTDLKLESDGVYWIGYYQSDISANAINYTDFNWYIGHCGTCDGGVMRKVWNNLTKYLRFTPFYVPSQNLDPDRKLFDKDAVMYDYEKNWGMNFKTQINCDLTDFYCTNKMSLKDALALKFMQIVLQDIKYSKEYNYINEDTKTLIRIDLEGDKASNAENIPKRLERELNNLYFDTGNLSKDCLPCTDKKGVEYSQA